MKDDLYNIGPNIELLISRNLQISLWDNISNNVMYQLQKAIHDSLRNVLDDIKSLEFSLSLHNSLYD